MKVSKLDSQYSLFLISLSFLLWCQYTTFDEKMIGTFLAGVFSLCEMSWTSITVETDDGGVILAPFSPNTRDAFTTPHQFIMNVLMMPFFFPLFYRYITYIPLRLTLFPIPPWVIELVEGYYLKLIYGYNPAWTYEGDLAFFDGNIKLTYYPPFFVIGMWMELGFFMTNFMNGLNII